MRSIKFYVIVICALSICACKRKPNDYQITMTGQYLEANFSLINGVKIDELVVTAFSKDSIPYEFYLKQSLSLKMRPDIRNKDHIRNLIFFDRPVQGYYWENDSAWAIYNISVVAYKYRGNISGKSMDDYSYQQQYDTYPSAFKSNSWYLIDFKSPMREDHHEFLHVDNDNNFIFYQLKDSYKDKTEYRTPSLSTHKTLSLK
ncbi:hypothetical protein SAMN05428949_6781 [Chitinophaga sp. YR627]|uniref:hypothetical protein n=1 Tax=Chitinophaga sp. YR627 TaxID=1881041 RepID=UPI0008EC3E48|nr:hypothetical protein [Chitinophaga sp. YR627]SFO86052.1 hypothetical protein SAMN05428949_6781 [Chitinophaga sp. YR627]